MRGELHFLYTFSYHAPFGDVGSEREVCSVYAGRSADEVRANAHEIAAWRWISADDLDREMRDQPEDFTPWFLQEWQEVRGSYRSVLGFSEGT
jgi:isopentenyl-diphosphate delta-isomerase